MNAEGTRANPKPMEISNFERILYGVEGNVMNLLTEFVDWEASGLIFLLEI